MVDGYVAIVGSVYYPECASGILDTITVEHWNAEAPSKSVDVRLAGTIVTAPGGGVGT